MEKDQTDSTKTPEEPRETTKFTQPTGSTDLALDAHSFVAESLTMAQEQLRPKIHAAIIAVMRDVGYVPKSGWNSNQKYPFRGIEQIYNVVHPLLCKHGVYSTSEILDASYEVEGKRSLAILKMRYTYWAADGSSVYTEVVGEGDCHSGDKANNKAMSAADKYALMQLLKIPTEDLEDSDRSTPDHKAPVTDKAAPQDLPRHDRVAFGGLTTAWKAKNPGKNIQAFCTWAEKNTKRDFDSSKANQWEEADVAEAMANLKGEA